MEEKNDYDPKVVAITKDGAVVGHLPREGARIVWYFLNPGGNGSCKVSGKRKKGKGHEVP